MRHYEDTVETRATPPELFEYVDDLRRFSAHMSESSWMMAGSTMDISIDGGNGQRVGSVVRMEGKVCGILLSLEEVVTEHESPRIKSWKTIGTPRLLVIGHYQMKLEIEPREKGSFFRVSIDYDLPPTKKWLGHFFGNMYAQWCVEQMIDRVRKHFA